MKTNAPLNTSVTPVVAQICLSPSAGGLELMAVRFSFLYQQNSIKAPLVCLENSFVQQRAEGQSLPIFKINKKQSFVSKIRSLVQFIDSESITHLLVHRLKDLKLVWVLKKLRPHLKVIGWAHIFIDYKKKDFFHRSIYSALDTLICMTETHRKNLLESLPIPPDKLQVIPLGIDLERFSGTRSTDEKTHFRQRHQIPQEAFLIGTAGRFDPQKGQLELLQAARQLKTSGYPFYLLLVGEDTEGEPGTKARCEQYILENDLQDRVKILGFIDGLEEFFANLDLFVMPSYQETFGLVLVEAMASGSLCLSTRAGGPIDILDGGALGPLVQPRSASALAEGIEAVIKNPSLWEKSRSESRKKALSTYNEKSLIENLKNLL